MALAPLMRSAVTAALLLWAFTPASVTRRGEMCRALWALHLSAMLGTLLVVQARESRAGEAFGAPLQWGQAPPGTLDPPLPWAGGGCHRGQTSSLGSLRIWGHEEQLLRYSVGCDFCFTKTSRAV